MFRCVFLKNIRNERMVGGHSWPTLGNLLTSLRVDGPKKSGGREEKERERLVLIC